MIVSYNGDLRGVVEDALGVARRVRAAVPSFHSVGAIVDGSSLLATVPAMVAREIRATRPHLRSAPLPFTLPRAPVELIWPGASDDDAAARLARDLVVRVAEESAGSRSRLEARSRRSARAHG